MLKVIVNSTPLIALYNPSKEIESLILKQAGER